MPTFFFGGQGAHLLIEPIHIFFEYVRMQEIPKGVHCMSESHHSPTMPMHVFSAQNASLDQMLVDSSNQPGSNEG